MERTIGGAPDGVVLGRDRGCGLILAADCAAILRAVCKGSGTGVEIVRRVAGAIAAIDECSGECSHRSNDVRCLKSVFR